MNIIKTNKACAACKYQRRKCSRDCPLAPYFPADKPKMFSNAHRLFGVSNIQRILKEIKDDDKKDAAMRSIIFESDIRAKSPVHGCLGVIMDYGGMLKQSMEELNHVKTLLAYCNDLQQKQHLHSSLPYTSSQIPNIPIFNNVGDVPNYYYYHNSENNNMMRASSSYVSDIIPHDVNYSGGYNFMEDNSNLMVPKELSSNEESYDLDGGVDEQARTTFDLGKKGRFSDSD